MAIKFRGSDAVKLGSFVKRERARQGLSQKELAYKSGVSVSAINKFENGRTKFPQMDTIDRINDALGINLDVGADIAPTEPKLSPEMLPPQDPLVRIQANSDNKLELQTSFSEDDDRDTIETYKSQFLDILANEISRYETNANRPQAKHFLPRHRALAAELSKPVEEINFASVYLAVNRLKIASDNADTELAKAGTEWPDFDPDEKEAIDSLCLLSGPLVMASSVGRKLVTDNAVYNLKEADEAETDRLLSLYIEKVKEQGVVSEETAAFFEAIDLPADSDPTPHRTRRVKFALVGSLMILTAGAAVVTVATLPTAVAIGTSSLAFLPYIWSKKVIENDPDFKILVQNGGTALHASSSKLSDGSARLLQKLGAVFRDNSVRLQRMGEIVSEFRWVNRFARSIERTAPLPLETSPGRSFLATHEETVFDKMFMPGDQNYVFNITERAGLERVIRVTRAGDTLVLLWEESSRMAAIMDRLIEKNREQGLADLQILALVTKEPENGSILSQFAPKASASIGSVAPEFMEAHEFEELAFYELTLPS